jgi:hypothetical protein
MGIFWKPEESRLIQSRTVVTAANADVLGFNGFPVPLGKIWVVIAFGYYPSVAETQVINFVKSNAGGQLYGLLNPGSMALNPAIGTFIEQGMEYNLFPSEFIAIYRGTHTAGSTMNATMEFIEVDQPLYTYDEPQVVKRQVKARGDFFRRIGAGPAGGGGGGGPMVDRGGITRGGKTSPPAV